jgi:large subunit ribosomal protein L19
MDIRAVLGVKQKIAIPELRPGDTVKTVSKYKEGDKDRQQNFQGMVVKIRRGSSGGNFTIRRVLSGVGVERTFFFDSPTLEKVEVTRHGQVRRAKLYYMRELSAKESRLKERREVANPEAVEAALIAEPVPVQTETAQATEAPAAQPQETKTKEK